MCAVLIGGSNRLSADIWSGRNLILADFSADLRIGQKTKLLKMIGRSGNRAVLPNFRPVYTQHKNCKNNAKQIKVLEFFFLLLWKFSPPFLLIIERAPFWFIWNSPIYAHSTEPHLRSPKKPHFLARTHLHQTTCVDKIKQSKYLHQAN